MAEDSKGLLAWQTGDLGELAFKRLCIQEGLHCSKLEPDRTGKDFLVEWPPETDSERHSYDKRPAPRRCFVQVKATGNDKPQVRLKLSAAEWLAKEDTPAFVIAPVFGGNDVDHYLAFHIRGEALSAILIRLREAQRDGQQLAQTTVTLPSKVGVQFPANGDGLRGYFETEIGHNILAYCQQKQHERSLAGFGEPHAVSMKVSFEVTDLAHIVECMLGERELEAELGQLHETRFGIPLPLVGASLPTGKVKLSVAPTPTERWTVGALDNAGNEIASIEGDAKTAVIPGMPMDLWRAEFSNGLVSVRFREMSLNVSFGGPEVWEEPAPLSVLRSSIRLWRALVVEDARISVCRIPDRRALIAKPAPEERERHDSWTRQILTLLDEATEIFRFCGVDDPKTTVETLWNNRRDMRIALQKIAQRQDSEASIGFSAPATSDLDAMIAENPRRVLLQTMPVIMGDDVLAIAVSYLVELKRSEDRIQIVSLARFPTSGAKLSQDDVFGAYEAFIANARDRVNPTFHAYYELLPVEAASQGRPSE